MTEGALKRYEASITRVNHRARTAEVRVDFHGKVLTMWLGFELIEPAEGGLYNGGDPSATACASGAAVRYL